MNSYTKFSRALILIFLSFSLFTTVSHAETTATNNRVVLIDDAHGQFINSSLLTGAINTLRDQGFKVISLTTAFNTQILNGIDLVLIPNPSRTSSYTTAEVYALSQWMKNEPDRGMIFLSNPFNSQNSSLSGAGTVFNKLFSDANFQLGDVFVLANNNDVVVQKYQNSTAESSDLTLQLNSTIPLPDINSTLTVETTSTAVTGLANQTILDAGYDSFYVQSDGAYKNQDKDNTLIIGKYFEKGKIIIGGSTTMFSDLPNPSSNTKTWFHSADNSAFFITLVKWTLGLSNAIFTPEVSSNFFISLALVTGVVGVIFVAIGTVMYATGKEMKIFEIDQDFLRAQSSEGQEETGLTKSQKRLQQRMKNK